MPRGRLKPEDRKREAHLKAHHRSKIPKRVLETALGLPVASDGTALLAPKVQALTTDAMNNLEAQLGGREALRKALGYAKNPKLDGLVAMMTKQEYAETPLENMLEVCQIRPIEMLEGIRDGVLAVAIVMSSLEIAGSLQKVTREVMEDAQNKEILCPFCGGTGKIGDGDKEQPCQKCWGKGTLFVPGNADSRKFALEMGGLLGNKGGVKVQINTQVNSGLPPAFEDMTRKALNAPVISVMEDFGVRPTNGS